MEDGRHRPLEAAVAAVTLALGIAVAVVFAPAVKIDVFLVPGNRSVGLDEDAPELVADVVVDLLRPDFLDVRNRDVCRVFNPVHRPQVLVHRVAFPLEERVAVHLEGKEQSFGLELFLLTGLRIVCHLVSLVVDVCFLFGFSAVMLGHVGEDAHLLKLDP